LRNNQAVWPRARGAERSVVDDDTLPGSWGLVNASGIRRRGIIDGRYRLLGRVGSGGTAAVYRARDLLLGGEVAVKILHEVLTADERGAALFRHEAQIGERLRHTNIVRTFGHHIVGEMHYIVWSMSRARRSRHASPTWRRWCPHARSRSRAK
jgi:hypothetical protein